MYLYTIDDSNSNSTLCSEIKNKDGAFVTNSLTRVVGILQVLMVRN